MSENLNKVDQTKVTKSSTEKLKENERIIYPGVKVVDDINFIPRSRLNKEDIKKFNIVRIDFNVVFKNDRDRINFKIYPFVNNLSNKMFEVIQGKTIPSYCLLVRLNDDISNNVRLTRNEYVDILLANKMPLNLTDANFSVLRYGRLIYSEKNDKRYYRLQLFLSFNLVKSFWISEAMVQTLSKLVESGYIEPITFYQATSEEFEDEATNDDLI